METDVIILSPVTNFIEDLDPVEQIEVKDLIDLLKEHGHKLSMPDAKPVGKGLWELRLHFSLAIRILYGFCDNNAILVLAFKKKRSAILPKDFKLALKRLKAYCQ